MSSDPNTKTASFHGTWAPCLCCTGSVHELQTKDENQNLVTVPVYTPWSSSIKQNPDFRQRASKLMNTAASTAECPLCNFPIERYLETDVCRILGNDHKAIITHHPQIVQNPAFELYDSPEAALAQLAQVHSAPDPLTRLVPLPPECLAAKRTPYLLPFSNRKHWRNRWYPDNSSLRPRGVTLDGLPLHSLLGLDRHLPPSGNDPSYVFLPILEAYQIASFPVLLTSHLVHGWDVLDRWFHDHPRTKLHLFDDTRGAFSSDFHNLPDDIALLTKKEEGLSVLLHRPGHRQKLNSRRQNRASFREQWYIDHCHLPLGAEWESLKLKIDEHSPGFNPETELETFNLLNDFILKQSSPTLERPRLPFHYSSIPVSPNTFKSSDLFSQIFKGDLPLSRNEALPSPSKAHGVSRIIVSFFESRITAIRGYLRSRFRRTLFRLLIPNNIRAVRHDPIFLRIIQNPEVRPSALAWYALALQLEARCLRFRKRVQSAPTCSQCLPLGEPHDDRPAEPVPAPGERAEHAVR